VGKSKSTFARAPVENRRREWPADMHSPVVFRALLRHERSRADRDGSEFSLVVLDVARLGPGDRSIETICRSIQDKIRSIDEAGWLDSSRIGILLPATTKHGGQTFAGRLCGSIPCVGSSIPWTVSTYPKDWLVCGDLSDGGTVPSRSQGVSSAAGSQLADTAVTGAFCRRVPVWKRCFDVTFAIFCLVLLSPLFLLLMLYIKVVSPGRVFFKQERVGCGGAPFVFLKFRTMHENNNSEAHREYLKELINSARPMEKLDRAKDPRIIRGARIIRKACLDELPQLVNVLRGEMSLVGPRPCIPYEAQEYLRWHTHRFDILPGMTGLWQVSGKNKLTFEQMVRLDISYAQRMSFLLDLKILLLTAPAIFGMVFEASVRRLGMRVLTPTAVSLAKGEEKGFLSDT
jgi:lipopolysaccharide/colanic/teichoic acid biosynthesis glycosyltransferase